MEEEIKETETVEEKVKEEEVEEVQVQAAAPEDEKPLEKMTVIELREIAKGIPGIIGAVGMKKAELLATIKEYRGINDAAPVKKKKIEKTGLTSKELKGKIALLKETKKTAQKEKDKKKITTLRRRINRLKKQLRKVAQA